MQNTYTFLPLSLMAALLPTIATAASITLPLEVLGPNGTTVSQSITIPSSANLSGQMTLWMEIHGLRSQTQASVKVNSSAWIPINSSNVTLLGNANAYGGIGGGFSTLKMTMKVPAGTILSRSEHSQLSLQPDGRPGERLSSAGLQCSHRCWNRAHPCFDVCCRIIPRPGSRHPPALRTSRRGKRCGARPR